jgi:ATP-dependent RNA helicase DeaD
VFPPVAPPIDRALQDRAYAEPTPVQQAVLAPEAAGRDLLVSARTGSGKTVAYGVALAPDLLASGDGERVGPAGKPLILIVAPTRELAMQVEAELSWLYAQTGAVLATTIGGMDARREARILARGAHIVVGTPGRLRDHIERNQLDLSALRALVLDEADEMLDLGFREDLTFILDRTPPERRTLLFSATIAREIAELARAYQRDALRLAIGSPREAHADIEYRALLVGPGETERAVVNVLRLEASPAALVFCATREGVKRMHAFLEDRGFAVVLLSGELSQAERTRALQSLRDGRTRICVATDVAARGLDLPELGLVLHADLPTNPETLLHRSGRTGRAGRKGASVLLVPPSRRRRAEQLLQMAHVTAIWSAPPGADAVRAADQARFLADPLLTEPATEEEASAARALLSERPAEAAAVALLRLHRARLPAPMVLSAPDTAPARRPRAEARADRPANGVAPAWFRLTAGRRENADPKWVLPLICRLGDVTRAEVGAIRIFDRETKFEITAEAADRFAVAVAARAGQEDARIEPAEPPRPFVPRDGAPPASAGKRAENPRPGRAGKAPWRRRDEGGSAFAPRRKGTRTA